MWFIFSRMSHCFRVLSIAATALILKCLPGSLYAGLADQVGPIAWEEAWPINPFERGKLYSTGGIAYLMGTEDAWICQDGFTWRSATDQDTLPADPVVKHDVYLYWDGTSLEIRFDPTPGREETVTTAVYFQDRWWVVSTYIQNGVPPKAADIYVSDDGIDWSLFNDRPSTFGLEEYTASLHVASGSLFLLENYKAKVLNFPYRTEIFDITYPEPYYTTQLKTRVSVLAGIDWEQIQSYNKIIRGALLEIDQRLFIIGSHGSLALEPQPDDPEPERFDTAAIRARAPFCGVIDSEQFAVFVNQQLYLASTDPEKLPKKVLSPDGSVQPTFAVNGDILLAANSDGRIWRRPLDGPWSEVAQLDLRGEYFDFRFQNGAFRLTALTQAFISIDGVGWSTVHPLPTPGSQYHLDAFGYAAKETISDNGLPATHYWMWSDHVGWREIATFSIPGPNALPIPEVGLMEIYDGFGISSAPNNFYTVRPSGRVEHWSSPKAQSGSEKPYNQHNSITYANGLIISGPSHVTDARLGSATSDLNSFRVGIFSHGRVWGYHNGIIYRSSEIPPYPFTGSQIYYDAWEYSSWFGWLNNQHYPWAYSIALGWIYVNGPDSDNCWIYDLTEGWFWTSRNYWPTIWSSANGWRLHSAIQSP